MIKVGHVASVGFLFALLLAATEPVAAATIAYPDMRVDVPTSEITIGHPTPSTRELRFSHVSWNAGAGPWEFRPSYDSSTGMATVQQALYVLTGPAQWAFDHAVPLATQMRYVPPDDYAFPLAQFALHVVQAD